MSEESVAVADSLSAALAVTKGSSCGRLKSAPVFRMRLREFADRGDYA